MGPKTKSPASERETLHRVFFSDARRMSVIADASVELVVTSPPYPMIAMWDPVFAAQDSAIATALENGRGDDAFSRMHRVLDPVWEEVYRILAPGGIACINIGDATRTLNNNFRLYPNHATIVSTLHRLGFSVLPGILWRKPTNSPTKFMGSGMLPAAAYVTLEHEHILIARKGTKREFRTDAKKSSRRMSAYFWEERNTWFSDVWTDLRGAAQGLESDRGRHRSGAFPLEIPYRLILMYSVYGDTVVDPFLGTGSTLLAAAAAGRNSVGFETEIGLRKEIHRSVTSAVPELNRRVCRRLEDHHTFVREQHREGHKFAHTSRVYRFPVVTGQETDLRLFVLEKIQDTGKNMYTATYVDISEDESQPAELPASSIED